jgi:hypothetical protein
MSRLNGLSIARASGARVIIGEADCYAWPQQVIVLTRSTAYGTHPEALRIARHEAAHHRQYLARPWLFRLRWFVPVRYWLEWDADNQDGRPARRWITCALRLTRWRG